MISYHRWLGTVLNVTNGAVELEDATQHIEVIIYWIRMSLLGNRCAFGYWLVRVYMCDYSKNYHNELFTAHFHELFLSFLVIFTLSWSFKPFLPLFNANVLIMSALEICNGLRNFAESGSGLTGEGLFQSCECFPTRHDPQALDSGELT